MMPIRFLVLSAATICIFVGHRSYGQERPAPTSGDAMIEKFLARDVDLLTGRVFESTTTRAEWEAIRPRLKAEFFQMLGLWPVPQRTPLHARVTRTLEREAPVVIEKIHFQSRPGLYVTGNLYRPVAGVHHGTYNLGRWCLIGRLEWGGDVEFRLQKQGHIRQNIADRDWLDIRHPGRPGVVSRKYQGLVGGQLEVLFLELIPDSFVNAHRIALGGWEQIDDQQVDTLLNQSRGLLDKCAKFTLAPLVARGDDFDHGDNLAVSMSDGNPIGLPRVNFGFGASDEAGARWGFCRGHGAAAGRCLAALCGES